MIHYSYLTIQTPSNAVYKEKGSKFLAFAFPVASEEEIKGHLKGLKKEYFDARHQGYAYVLGPGKDKYRTFDDGEPSHSAGDPILGQIRSRNLTNVLVVVVRYFGGVKLGIGGLISAYKTAATSALKKTIIVETDVTEEFEIQFDYGATSEVMRLINEFSVVILKKDFTEGCRMSVDLKLSHRELFQAKIKSMGARGIKIALCKA